MKMRYEVLAGLDEWVEPKRLPLLEPRKMPRLLRVLGMKSYTVQVRIAAPLDEDVETWCRRIAAVVGYVNTPFHEGDKSVFILGHIGAITAKLAAKEFYQHLVEVLGPNESVESVAMRIWR